MIVGCYLWCVLLFGNGRKVEIDIRLYMFEYVVKLF